MTRDEMITEIVILFNACVDMGDIFPIKITTNNFTNKNNDYIEFSLNNWRTYFEKIQQYGPEKQ